MRHHDPVTVKTRVHRALAALARADRAGRRTILGDLWVEDAVVHASHPVGTLAGREAFEGAVLAPLKAAFPDLERRDDILVGGSHHGVDWIAATGHYHGVFAAPFLGIPAHEGWASLRYGEFYRLEDGRVAEAYLLYDLLDLMRQAEVNPWRKGLGRETLVPGPATRDGVRLGAPDPAASAASLALVEAMLGPLFEPDRASMGMERFWSPDMMWFGPCGIGTTRGIDGFHRLHQDPWTAAIPDWRADLDTPHVADDAYVAFLGWPSIEATQTGPMLGIPPTGRRVEINLMDFWRREGDLLAENWIFIDLPHMALQLGVDVFAEMAALAAGARRR